jgi:hypothetical protein
VYWIQPINRRGVTAANGSYKHPNPEKGKVAYQKTLVTDKGLDLIERLLIKKPETKPTIH